MVKSGAVSPISNGSVNTVVAKNIADKSFLNMAISSNMKDAILSCVKMPVTII
jgi:hypothetical protein